ncbi:hypothetical protein B0T14DRAFT_494913 [Immersiella caudata]|uniref:PXA domain-containing protein n=1 Tax=Immersiella caudata TaxID=314043 RepID=A0AA39WXH1_9PEZI|nr:hypothetical protein B0T14DRAFT_494913 [Immersiella caudata]
MSLLSYGIHRYMLDPAGLPPLLRNVRGALFPNNAPGTPTLVAPSSDAELLALRRRCAKALWALVPNNGGVGRLYFNAHSSSSPAPLFGRTGLSQRGEAAYKGGRTRGGQRPTASASTSAAAPQAVTEGSTQVCQQGHGSAAALEGQSLSPASKARAAGSGKALRSAPRSGGPSGGGGRQSSLLAASMDDGAAAALEAQKKIGVETAGHTDNADMGSFLAQEPHDVDEATLQEIERGILGVFSDAYSNKHLVYGIVELILVRILPELAEEGITELWSERLSS